MTHLCVWCKILSLSNIIDNQFWHIFFHPILNQEFIKKKINYQCFFASKSNVIFFTFTCLHTHKHSISCKTSLNKMNKDKNILCSHLPKPSLILVCDFPICKKMNWFILFGRATFQMNCVQLAPYFKTYTYKQNFMRDRCTDRKEEICKIVFHTIRYQK